MTAAGPDLPFEGREVCSDEACDFCDQEIRRFRCSSEVHHLFCYLSCVAGGHAAQDIADFRYELWVHAELVVSHAQKQNREKRIG